MRAEMFKRDDDRWAWRLVAANGRVVATDGNQGYENKGDCKDSLLRVILGAYKNAPIVEVAE